MFGLEPREKHRLALDLPLAKAHKGVHAMHVFIYRFDVTEGAHDIGIRRAIEQMPLAAMNSPQQPVEQREPIGRRVT